MNSKLINRMGDVFIGTTDKISKAVKIRSIQANSLYRVNKDYENAYIDYGDAVINDNIFLNFMRKHGMTVNKRNKSSDFIMMKFDYGAKDGKNKNIEIEAKELREYYYENGANVPKEKIKEGKAEEIKYKMLMRSTGKAKDGDCIFIRDELHAKALNYITMGLFDKMPDENVKLVELSAYSTLITATAIDYINIPLKNIFVVKDKKVTTRKKCVEVKDKDVPYTWKEIDYNTVENYINKLGMTFYKRTQKEKPELKYIDKSQKSLKENGIEVREDFFTLKEHSVKECYTDNDQLESEVENVLWDGMGLIDESIFPENMEGFIYCRSHFFKSCLFRGNLQQYFKEHYGERYADAVEIDMFGRKMKVSDIKVIITDNSLKWMKFIDLMGGTKEQAFGYYSRFMKKDGERFDIVKTAHTSKWGDLQRSSYQMNGSLPTTDRAVLKKIAKTSIEYCNNLKLDHNAFLKHLELTETKYNINKVLLALNEWNDEFKYTDFFKHRKDKLISRFKTKRLQLGKLFQTGDNLTICGNPIALLIVDAPLK